MRGDELKGIWSQSHEINFSGLISLFQFLLKGSVAEF